MKTSLKIALIIFLSTWLSVLIGQITQIGLIPSLIIAAFLAFLAWFLILTIFIRPILDLNQVTKILAKGNLGKKIPLKAHDEIGELEKNLSEMTTNLVSGLQHFAFSLRNEKLKEAEIAQNLKELEQQKAKIEALLSSIGDGVIAIDQEDKIILFNKKASLMSGFTLGEIMSQPYQTVLRFVDEKDGAPIKDIIKIAASGGVIDKSLHLALLKKDNQTIPVSQSTSLILDDKGQSLGVVVALRDITQERELDHLKDEFVSVASHELRTPMTAIKGFVSMIQEGDYGQVNAELKEPLGDISSSVERLIQLVNDLLDVSRIEANRVKLELTTVPIQKAVAEVTDLLKVLTDRKGLKLDYQEVGPEAVYADLGKIKEILNNLIGNSLKFTDHGYIKVSSQKAGNKLQIKVSDSGLGIPLEEQGNLFRKFQQISSNVLGRPTGTGLGLYISKEFARKMNGDLYLEKSQPNEGSTFTLVLPLAKT